MKQLQPLQHVSQSSSQISGVHTLPPAQVIQTRLQTWMGNLPLRNDLHLARKIWHASMGMLIVGLYAAGFPRTLALIVLTSVFSVAMILETLRLRNPHFNERCIKAFSLIMRGHEVKRYSTVPYFLAASVVSIAVFPKTIALLALTYLALGDPAASFFGVLSKKHSIKLFGEKSLQGSLGCFAVCALASYFYLRQCDYVGLNLVRLSLLGGFGSAFAETVPLEIDDNFTIPVVSGAILWLGFVLIS